MVDTNYQSITVQGKTFKVDNKDAKDVLNRDWEVTQAGSVYTVEEGRPIRFHRYVGMRTKAGGRCTFVGEDKLDCRQSNLNVPTNPKPKNYTNGRPKKSQAGQIRVIQATVTAWVAEATNRDGHWKRLAVSFDRSKALEAALEKM